MPHVALLVEEDGGVPLRVDVVDDVPLAGVFEVGVLLDGGGGLAGDPVALGRHPCTAVLDHRVLPGDVGLFDPGDLGLLEPGCLGLRGLDPGGGLLYPGNLGLRGFDTCGRGFRLLERLATGLAAGGHPAVLALDTRVTGEPVPAADALALFGLGDPAVHAGAAALGTLGCPAATRACSAKLLGRLAGHPRSRLHAGAGGEGLGLSAAGEATLGAGRDLAGRGGRGLGGHPPGGAAEVDLLEGAEVEEGVLLVRSTERQGVVHLVLGEHADHVEDVHAVLTLPRPDLHARLAEFVSELLPEPGDVLGGEVAGGYHVVPGAHGHGDALGDVVARHGVDGGPTDSPVALHHLGVDLVARREGSRLFPAGLRQGPALVYEALALCHSGTAKLLGTVPGEPGVLLRGARGLRREDPLDLAGLGALRTGEHLLVVGHELARGHDLVHGSAAVHRGAVTQHEALFPAVLGGHGKLVGVVGHPSLGVALEALSTTHHGAVGHDVDRLDGLAGEPAVGGLDGLLLAPATGLLESFLDDGLDLGGERLAPGEDGAHHGTEPCAEAHGPGTLVLTEAGTDDVGTQTLGHALRGTSKASAELALGGCPGTGGEHCTGHGAGYQNVHHGPGDRAQGGDAFPGLHVAGADHALDHFGGLLEHLGVATLDPGHDVPETGGNPAALHPTGVGDLHGLTHVLVNEFGFDHLIDDVVAHRGQALAADAVRPGLRGLVAGHPPVRAGDREVSDPPALAVAGVGDDVALFQALGEHEEGHVHEVVLLGVRGGHLDHGHVALDAVHHGTHARLLPERLRYLPPRPVPGIHHDIALTHVVGQDEERHVPKDGFAVGALELHHSHVALDPVDDGTGGSGVQLLGVSEAAGDEGGVACRRRLVSTRPAGHEILQEPRGALDDVHGGPGDGSGERPGGALHVVEGATHPGGDVLRHLGARGGSRGTTLGGLLGLVLGDELVHHLVVRVPLLLGEHRLRREHGRLLGAASGRGEGDRVALLIEEGVYLGEVIIHSQTLHGVGPRRGTWRWSRHRHPCSCRSRRRSVAGGWCCRAPCPPGSAAGSQPGTC